MDKLTITKRIDELKKFQQAKIQEAQAAEGAIQDCLYWLDELEKPKEEKKENKKNG